MNSMTSSEKAELLKDTIYQLYCKEGRSFSYIGRLLQINRQTISGKIREWNFPEPEPVHHLKPSNQKFLNKNRQFIKAKFDADIPETRIAEMLGVSRDYLRYIVSYDEVLSKARTDYNKRILSGAEERRQTLMDKSSRNYNIASFEGEEWRPILGYDGYYVSNYGRIKKYAASYKSFYLLKTFIPDNGQNRIYVSICGNNGAKNFQVSRLVAHAFCDGYSTERNTVNHKDGNPQNNRADNLEWMSQSENNKHAYRHLGRSKVRTGKMPYKKIVYKGKYEFKTVAAFSRFIGMSETQTRRYLEQPDKHEIRLIM